MKRIGSYFFIVLAMIFFIACEESVVEENGSQGPSTETPIQKDTLKPGKIVTVTSTDFSLDNGIDDPYDSLFINFDGKIIEWITRNRLGTFIGVKASSGFCVYPLYLLY